MQVDDSQLTDEDRQFLQQWAEGLNVTLDVLLGRILNAAIHGERYVEKMPI